MEAGTDKSQKPLEIRAFGQKESTATLIPIVSKLRCFFGGPEGDRTLDLTDANRTLSQTELRAQINRSQAEQKKRYEIKSVAEN